MDNSNIIILNSAYNKTPGQAFYIQPARRPDGMWPDCVREEENTETHKMILSDSDKEYISKGGVLIPATKLIKVVHGQTFDLNIPAQKATWEAIQYSSFIAPDRFAKDQQGVSLVDGERSYVDHNGIIMGRNGIADLYIERPGLVSKSKNETKKKIHKAQGFVLGDTIEGWVTKCRLLEKDMSKAHASDIEDYLLTQAEKYPDKIIDLYTGTTTAIRLLIIEAIAKGVLVKKGGVLIYADDLILGTSVDSAINYLSDPDHIKIKELIQRETFPDLYKKESKEEPKTTKK